MEAKRRQVGGEHYTALTLQPWDVLEHWLTPEERRGYYWGTIIKYLGRWPSKGGVQDLEKAKHFLEQLIEHEHNNNERARDSVGKHKCDGREWLVG